MAMQTGVELSKILILAGAGYTGTVLFKNGTLSDLLGELQSLLKGLENSGDQSDDSEALLAQGISFPDLFWVMKHNMAAAVENLTKHLDSMSDALSNLDDKMETQKEISKNIQDSVEEARMNLSNIEYDLDELQRMISGLDLANVGVWYLGNMVDGKKAKMPEAMQEQLKLSGKSRSFLAHSGTPTTKGLKDFADIFSQKVKDSCSDAIVEDGIDNLGEGQEAFRGAFQLGVDGMFSNRQFAGEKLARHTSKIGMQLLA